MKNNASAFEKPNHYSLYKAIENAIILPARDEMAALSKEEVDFSENYKKKMNRLKKRQKKMSYKIWGNSVIGRAVSVAALALMIGLGVFMALPSIEETPIDEVEQTFIRGISVKRHEKAGVADVTPLRDGKDKEGEYQYYAPIYIPTGLEATPQEKEHGSYSVSYWEKDGKRTAEYWQVDSNTLQGVGVTIKDRTNERIVINNCDAFISYNEEKSTLVWSNRAYVYYISGDLTHDEIIAMAQSMRLVGD